MINRIKEILHDCFENSSSTCQVTTNLLREIVAELELLMKECGECHGDEYLQPCNTCGRGKIGGKEFVRINYESGHPILELADGSNVTLSKNELIVKEKELSESCEITKKKLIKLERECASLDKQHRLVTWAIEQENKVGKKRLTLIIDGQDCEEWVAKGEKLYEVRDRVLLRNHYNLGQVRYRVGDERGYEVPEDIEAFYVPGERFFITPRFG